jgi:hypothetical protein
VCVCVCEIERERERERQREREREIERETKANSEMFLHACATHYILTDAKLHTRGRTSKRKTLKIKVIDRNRN